MFKIVLFLEKSDDAWSTPHKIGSLFLNMLIIDENSAIEVLAIHHLANSYSKMSFSRHDEFQNYQRERIKKETEDLKVFQTGIEQASKCQFDHLKPFFIYAGNYYRWKERVGFLKSIFRSESNN